MNLKLFLKNPFFFLCCSAFCYHCCRNLCLDHLTEHSQLLDALTRSILEENFQILTNLFTRLQSLTISSKILNEPFLKIEQWRINAYRQIDEICEKKFEEIQKKIAEYRIRFEKIRNEQLDKITRYKQKIAELFRETQVANKDLSNLKKSIEKIQNESKNFDYHSIEVISKPTLIPSINIQLKLNNWDLSSKYISLSSSSSSSSTSSSLSLIIQQLEFRLKFVRLSGFVTSHYVLVQANGTIGDLIDRFIQIQDNCVKRKRNYYLATEVCQYRVRQRFKNEIQLQTIFNKINELVLYEIPFELDTNNLQQYCFILCRFQDGLPWDIHFGLPILLHVPRFQCRGKNIIDALNQILNTCFPLIIEKNHNNNNINYEVRIVSDDDQTSTPTILNQWADQIIDDHLLMADNATLIVNLINSEQSYINDKTTHLARLDGILKTNEKRRKSRK